MNLIFKQTISVKKTVTLLLLTLLVSTGVFSQSATLTGSVIDGNDKSPLPFSSILVKGTTIGVSTNIDGKFILTGIPAGKQIVVFSYIGYNTIQKEIQFKPGITTTMDVLLSMESIMGKEITVTAQMKGQMQAINQQVNAKGIINVVSAEKLKELPDGNVADAMGRLPGIMVQRNGGEGEKIIIRGLDPKYSTVSVNGAMAPSTDPKDRSVNLNLISPDIISGLEIMKANTADQDADGLGGTVNMVVKEADKERKLNLSLQGGYSGQIKDFGHAKGTLFYSQRFFNKKIGLMLSGSAESTDRSSEEFKAAYEVTGDPLPGKLFVQPFITSVRLESNSETRNRYNLSANLDYSIGKSTFKMVNMFSRTDKNIFNREKRYDTDGASVRFYQFDVQEKEWMISNSLDAKHIIGRTQLTWGASRSQSAQNTPYDHSLQFRHSSAFAVSPADLSLLNPLDLPTKENMNEKIENYYLYDGVMLNSKSAETESSFWLNYEIPYNINDKVGGFLKIGGKGRWKDRENKSKRWYERFDTFTSPIVDRESFTKATNGHVGIVDFLDPDFTSTNFLNGLSPNLNIDKALDRQVVSDWYQRNIALYEDLPTIKVKEDYWGNEAMYAAYIMGEINFGKYVTFIPGVRFDYTQMTYSAYKGDGLPPSDDSSAANLVFEEQTESSNDMHILPQIHLRIKPFKGFDIRLAYTNTLSRPDFDYLAPRTQISPSNSTIRYSTPKIKSATSENFDVILSYYNQKVGLFSVSAFRKNISNFVYMRTARVIKGSDTDPSQFNVPDLTNGYIITYPVNNPAMSYINGIEVEAQTNFKYLPNPFKGIVLSANMTFMNSETKYQSTLIKRVANPNYGQPGEPRAIFVNQDTTYTDRLLKQPDFLANISLGYDIKGFSARISYSYMGNILTMPQYRIDGADKESTLAFARWDLQLKQKIGKKISVYASVENIFNEADKAVRNVTNYYTYIENYGMAAKIGLKLDIFK